MEIKHLLSFELRHHEFKVIMNLKVSRVACFPSAMFSCMGKDWSRHDLIMVVFQPSKSNAA